MDFFKIWHIAQHMAQHQFCYVPLKLMWTQRLLVQLVNISQILYTLIIWLYLLNLSVIENMLKLANMAVSLSIFLNFIFCFIYFDATLLSTYSFKKYWLSGWLIFLLLWNVTHYLQESLLPQSIFCLIKLGHVPFY